MSDYQSRLDAVDRSVQTLTKQAAADIANQRSPSAQQRIIKNLVHQVRQLERHSVLMSLMSAQDVANHYGVTKRRIQAKVKWLREERGHDVGWQVSGTNTWLFHPDELPNLSPMPAGRPKGGRGD